jgi:hypothetical protein
MQDLFIVHPTVMSFAAAKLSREKPMADLGLGNPSPSNKLHLPAHELTSPVNIG